MPRTTKEKTRRKLRDAVVAEAVEKGFGAVSVAGVVSRARVSAGTVYVHFANKDDMLRAVYMEIKAEFHAAIMQAAQDPDTASRIRRMWYGMFEFVARAPKELLFLEFGSAARILTPAQQAVADRYAGEIAEVLGRGVEDGTLAPLEPRILSLLLVAPAMQLARGAVLRGTTISPATIDATFERVWLSIAR